jgi:hypothetical protein
MSRLTDGVLAGLAGTALLNATAYADMTLRGRAPSTVPEQTVDVLLARAGVRLDPAGERSANRRSGLAALSGYATGALAGLAYGLAEPALRRLPRPFAATAVGLATMAGTDASIAAAGVSDPATWSAADWASDIVPHLIFGAGVVVTFDRMARAR